MENITPPFLERGDTIGLFAPSRYVSQEYIQTAIHFFTSHGFVVKIPPHFYSQHFQFAGTEVERASDFNVLVEDRDVKAILCARGGYGTVRILDLINLRKLQLNPKWIIGNGDITLLHSFINSWYGVESLNAIMPKDYPNTIHGNESLENMIKTLMGSLPSYDIPHNALNKLGLGEGILTGGNLNALTSQIGTGCDINTQEKILFIEHSKCMLYEIDRMMMQLKRSGKLKSLKGLIIGIFADIEDSQIPFGANAYEIINNIVKEYKYPVCYGFQTGRGSQNMPLIMGRRVRLEVDGHGSKITFCEASSLRVNDEVVK